MSATGTLKHRSQVDRMVEPFELLCKALHGYLLTATLLLMCTVADDLAVATARLATAVRLIFRGRGEQVPCLTCRSSVSVAASFSTPFSTPTRKLNGLDTAQNHTRFSAGKVKPSPFVATITPGLDRLMMSSSSVVNRSVPKGLFL